MRLIVAMTGATGAIFGIRLLEALQEMRVETHLVISRWARATIKQETPFSTGQVASLATVSYAPEDKYLQAVPGDRPWTGSAMRRRPCPDRPARRRPAEAPGGTSPKRRPAPSPGRRLAGTVPEA
jgi:4-hydroxy-3-polyprenylbenzoate decarboxylase